MDAGQAAVVMDALLETGEATWPRVGHFVLVLSYRHAIPREGVVDFPTRDVKFVAAPEASEEVKRRGGRVEFEGFGTFVLGTSLVFHSAPGLRARLIKTPAGRFAKLADPAPPPSPRAPPARAVKKKSWWERLFS
jgi:hypothetical protein